MELIQRLHSILTLMKDFTCGYTSSNPNAFLLEYKGARYKVELKRIANPDEDMFKDIDKYLSEEK